MKRCKSLWTMSYWIVEIEISNILFYTAFVEHHFPWAHCFPWIWTELLLHVKQSKHLEGVRKRLKWRVRLASAVMQILYQAVVNNDRRWLFQRSLISVVRVRVLNCSFWPGVQICHTLITFKHPAIWRKNKQTKEASNCWAAQILHQARMMKSICFQN